MSFRALFPSREHCEPPTTFPAQQPRKKIQQIADGISLATGTRVQLDWGASVPPVMADRHLTEVVQMASTELLGSSHVTSISQASMGGDDFAFYSRTLPASFMRIGCAGQRCGNIPLHNPGFDVDEKVLADRSKSAFDVGRTLFLSDELLISPCVKCCLSSWQSVRGWYPTLFSMCRGQ